LRFDRLAPWLEWQRTLHPLAMDLGLDRVRQVAAGLGLERLPAPVVVVEGTNGKGSCVAYLEAILGAAGRCVAAFTSPWLLRFEESVRVGGREAGEADLLEAFDAVDRARGATTLTEFEFQALAAAWWFRACGPDVILLEVGLGGPGDAVHAFAADLSLLTTCGVDHMEWLGRTRESVARAQATGIARAGCPLVCGDPDPPPGLEILVRERGASLLLAGRDFRAIAEGPGWRFEGPGGGLDGLPPPGIPGCCQLGNAAAAIAILGLLPMGLRPDPAAVRSGLAAARLAGRQQRLPGPLERIVDVAHNPEAASALAGSLARESCRGRTRLVLGMLLDKDHAGLIAALAPQIDAWYLADLPGPRGGSGQRLAEVVAAVAPAGQARAFPDVAAAWETARKEAEPGDRLVACGSFLTAREVLRLESARRGPDTAHRRSYGTPGWTSP
jgi:dihydrofolate synthase / folylpolyglutamate synthase